MNIYQRFEEKNLSVDEFLDFEDNAERAALLGHKNPSHYMIPILLEFCKYMPKLKVDYDLKPIAQTILKIDLTIVP